MQDQMTFERLEQSRGVPVLDKDGEKIGKVEEVFYDEQTNEPEWIGLGTGFFGAKRVLVPVRGAEVGEDAVTVPYEKDRVKDAPDIDANDVSMDTERALYAHYGLDYSQQESATGLPDADRYMERDPAASEGEVIRSEEELKVGKREVERGRLRLHKWVETEQVDVPVEVRREKARVYTEPVEGSARSDEIGEDSIEVTLSEEEPVVEKQTVAKERIGIDKQVETEQQTVGEQVRKERVDVEGDDVS